MKSCHYVNLKTSVVHLRSRKLLSYNIIGGTQSSITLFDQPTEEVTLVLYMLSSIWFILHHYFLGSWNCSVDEYLKAAELIGLSLWNERVDIDYEYTIWNGSLT